MRRLRGPLSGATATPGHWANAVARHSGPLRLRIAGLVLRQLQPSLLHAQEQQGADIAHARLLQQPGPVRARGLVADAQRARDFLVAQAAPEPFQIFALALREWIIRGCRPAFLNGSCWRAR